MSRYYCLSVLVTTHCDRRCPDCCYRLGRSDGPPARHYGWDAFARAAVYLAGVEHLCVSGGEPTLHPLFPDIASGFRSLFGPQRMVLATNGEGVVRHARLMSCFDEVVVTAYGAPADQAAIAWLRANHPERLTVHPPEHIDLARVGDGRPCFRQRIAALVGERLYPCCLGPGVAGAASIAVGPGWQDALVAVPLPCAQCIFSVAA